MNQCNCGLLGSLTFPLLSQNFCEKCFSQRFEKKFLKNIPMRVRGHSVAIALSGGKDSMTAFHIFAKYQKKLRIRNLFAFTLEEEIPEIQIERKNIINQIKKNYPKVITIERTYTELFGYSLIELTLKSDSKGLRFTPCAICGILRRHGLQRIALEYKVEYIVKGHTLNDEAETILLNIIRGIPQRNLRNQIHYQSTDEIALPLTIKPLSKFTENTIQYYSNLNTLKAITLKCPLAERSLRSKIRIFLNELKTGRPGLLFNIASKSKNCDSLPNHIVHVQKCKSCNSHSPNVECSACRLVKYIMSVI